MIKRLFILTVFGVLAAALVLGWFGYRAYVNVTDAIAYRQQFEAVSNGDVPRPDAPAGHGMYPIQKVRVTNAGKGQLEALVSERGCAPEPDAVEADTATTDLYVAVLIHTPARWLPDFGALWRDASRLISGSGCSGVARLRWVPVPLGGPLAGRPVMDAVTGRVVYPAR